MESFLNLRARTLQVSFLLLVATLLIPDLANAQINFPKNRYYVAMGDSLSAGEGAMPVTQGAVYRLYHQGVFGPKKEMDFSNISIRAARTWEVLSYQVPQAICLSGFEPTVVTITVGANDFLRAIEQNGLPQNEAELLALLQPIAARSAEIVRRLRMGFVYAEPSTGTLISCPVPRPSLRDVTVLIANNFALPIPNEPILTGQLDIAASTYDILLRLTLQQMGLLAPGQRVAVADLYSAFKDRQGLLLIQKKNGVGPGFLNIEVHPTNAGHAAIALAFQRAWATLPPQP